MSTPRHATEIALVLFRFLLLSFGYGVATLIASARDWGDSIYVQNPVAQVHDKLSVSFTVGIFSGLYIGACVAVSFFALRQAHLRKRLPGLLLTSLLAGVVVQQVAHFLISHLATTAQYVQHSH